MSSPKKPEPIQPDEVQEKARRQSILPRVFDAEIVCAGWLQVPTNSQSPALGLTLNEQKTRIVDANEETFEFLGYAFGWEYYRKTGNPYLAAQPSKKSVRRLKRKIKRWLKRGRPLSWEMIVTKLNQKLEGWANYFHYGTRLFAYRAIDHYVYEAVTDFLADRHKTRARKRKCWSHEAVFGQLGVLELRSVQLDGI